MSKEAFPNAQVERLIREAGAEAGMPDVRVGSDSIKMLNRLLGEYGNELAKYAVELARHSGRKTVKESDVQLSSLR